MTISLFLSLIVIVLTVVAVLRGVDVRLALLLAAGLLGLLGGDPASIVRIFLQTLAREQFVVPICTAMGFAHVLRLTGCDQHLVHLLVKPLERVHYLVLPGAVLVGFFVNVPIISQTSTAVAIGSVLIPLLLAARISSVTTGAALLLGASMGGELLNPGAPELRTIATALGIASNDCVEHIVPLLAVQVVVATGLFWILSLRADAGPSCPRRAGGRVSRVNCRSAHCAGSLNPAFSHGPPFTCFVFRPTGSSTPRTVPRNRLRRSVLSGRHAGRRVPRPGRQPWQTDGAFFEGLALLTRTSFADCRRQLLWRSIEQVGLADVLGQVTAWARTLDSQRVGFPGVCLAERFGFAATPKFVWLLRETGRGWACRRSTWELPCRSRAARRTISPVAAVTLMRIADANQPHRSVQAAGDSASGGPGVCAGDGSLHVSIHLRLKAGEVEAAQSCSIVFFAFRK